MKNVVTDVARRAKTIQLYIDMKNQTHHLDESGSKT